MSTNMGISNINYLGKILDDYNDMGEKYEVKLPSLEHCIGTKRLLGEHYGPAICSLFRMEKSDLKDKLTELCILLRSHIVLDDYRRDALHLNSSASEYINRCLEKVKKRTLSLLKSISHSDEKLWHYHQEKIKDAYIDFDYNKPFDSVLNKCSFVFLPFELSIFPKRSIIKNKLILFIKYFLFSLQLMDDFHDMEEDLNSYFNHNLFISKKSDKCISLLINGRRLILSSILPYIKQNLANVYSTSFNNSIIEVYYRNSTAWLDKNINYLKVSSPLKLFDGSYETFKTSEKYLQRFTNDFLNSKPIQISEIRAETMHSI